MQQRCFSAHRGPASAGGPCRVARGRALAVRVRASSVQTAASTLQPWLASKGVSFDKVEFSSSLDDGQPCLVATKDIKAGEGVLSVPSSCWLTPQAVQASPLGKLVAGRDAWLQLALLLMYDRFGAGKQSPARASALQAYVADLPDRVNTPLLWTAAELAELKGTQLLGQVSSYQAYFESVYADLSESLFAKATDAFPAGSSTYEQFLWAVATVRARSHAPQEGEAIALVPGADAVRHRRLANVAWQVGRGLAWPGWWPGGGGGGRAGGQAFMCVHKIYICRFLHAGQRRADLATPRVH